MGRRSYPDEEWALVALMREDAPQREYPPRETFNALRYVVRTGVPWRWLPPGKRSMPRPSAVLEALVHRTLPSTPERGRRGGYDGAKRRRGSKVRGAVDTLGRLLARAVTPADVGDRERVKEVQEATGGRVEAAFVDQGYTGERAAEAARGEGVEPVVVRLPEARRGFVLSPGRWVVERSFAWLTRFCRLVRDWRP